MERVHSSAALVSTDVRLIRVAEASAAAVGASLAVVAQPEELRLSWRNAASVLIGSDQLESVHALALPAREQVYLLGFPDARERLCRWSAPLGASVIVLADGREPTLGQDGAKWLSRVIAGRAPAADTGTVVAVRGGAGGVGTSTLAASLAVLAAKRPLSVALVDGDVTGGGLDLLLGAENAPGWRWDKLRSATGQIADIASMLPRVEGVTLVSMERIDPRPPPAAAYEAVVDCLARTHDLVLIDAGRTMIEARTLLVTNQTVRSLAAARLAAKFSGDTGLVVRKGGCVSPREAARVLDLPLVGVIPSLRDLTTLADRGVPPLVSGRWKRACTRVLAWCLGEAGRR
ncbi:MAG: P-loop NTPase [Propionibacteriaceae bacterium]|nr:P-loop NTPase [Propionibacteriaceae bacterium]